MKRTEQERMLRGILDDENLARVRRDSLAGGLAAVRIRRRRRAPVASAAVSIALVLSIVALSHRQRTLTARLDETKSRVASRGREVDQRSGAALALRGSLGRPVRAAGAAAACFPRRSARFDTRRKTR